MEAYALEAVKSVALLPDPAGKAVVNLAGNFLCANCSVDKLREDGVKEIARISSLEGVSTSTTDLEKMMEAIVWYIEARYSKPYEASQGELEKLGNFFISS